VLTLSEVSGQSQAISVLRRAVQSNRLAHAYVFSGPKGCGAFATAQALAKALNCLNAPGEGCHDCDSCHKIDNHTHPDIRTLLPEGKQQRIPIETIRKQVIPCLATTPHQARVRVFLVEEATNMMGPAANALLKTLEEPPPRTHFFLCTHAPSRLLSTIRSRCQRVLFQQRPFEMQAKEEGQQEKAQNVLALAQSIENVANERGLDNIITLAASVSKASERPILLGALSQCLHNFHQAARLAAKERQFTIARAHAARIEQTLQSLRAISEHNAHGQLALEHLLVAFRNLPIPSPLPLSKAIS